MHLHGGVLAGDGDASLLFKLVAVHHPAGGGGGGGGGGAAKDKHVGGRGGGGRCAALADAWPPRLQRAKPAHNRPPTHPRAHLSSPTVTPHCVSSLSQSVDLPWSTWAVEWWEGGEGRVRRGGGGWPHAPATRTSGGGWARRPNSQQLLPAALAATPSPPLPAPTNHRHVADGCGIGGRRMAARAQAPPHRAPATPTPSQQRHRRFGEGRAQALQRQGARMRFAWGPPGSRRAPHRPQHRALQAALAMRDRGQRRGGRVAGEGLLQRVH